MSWVVQHEFDHEPTYVVLKEDDKQSPDDKCVTFGTGIPQEVRCKLALRLANLLNQETGEKSERISRLELAFLHFSHQSDDFENSLAKWLETNDLDMVESFGLLSEATLDEEAEFYEVFPSLSPEPPV